jgi:hypothetical protein
MKKKTCFILLLSVVLIGCAMKSGLKSKTRLDRIQAQRELLKDYFLCKCIVEGFKDLQIIEYDISQSVYFDIARYDPEAFQEVAEYAKEFTVSIETSPIEDLGYKKAIILNCIDKYKSKEINNFIKSMDKYMVED